MVCVTKRRGAWVVDGRVHGRRVVKVFATKRKAEEGLAKLTQERQQRRVPAVDPFVTLAEYTPRFLADCEEAEVASKTLTRYRCALANHILPALGEKKLRDIAPSDVRTFVLSKRQPGTNLQGQKGHRRVPKRALSKATVNQLRSVLSCVLALAVEEEIIGSNPAHAVRRRRSTKAKKKQAKVGMRVKALDREQRNLLLAVAAEHEPESYPAFMLMALAGLRRGECLGLKWPAVDFETGRVHVREQILDDSPKSGEARVVEMATPLADALRSLLARRRSDSFRDGERMSPYVVFSWLSEKPDAREEQRAAKRLLRSLQRCLKLADLPRHFNLHSLRHTFCSLLIAQGESPVFVQQAAGHASVEMTVGVYGSWFAVSAPGAMNRLAGGLLRARPATLEGESGNINASDYPPPPLSTGTYGRPDASRPFPG